MNNTKKNCGCPHNPNEHSSYEKPINIALQGGGAHGAFAWGVLDKIIEDGRLKIDGLCGTSAGAMNAVVYAYGNMMSGPEGARKALHDFWKRVSGTGARLSFFNNYPMHEYIEKWLLHNTFNLFEIMSRSLSPYQFNPLNLNPLRDILNESVDFDVLEKCQETKLFISTTKVKTGKVRVFTTNEITIDVIMASACLPQLFPAVKIEDEYYWDGGYMGNPALFPLFYETDTRDVIIIHINPMVRSELPTEARDIMNRLNEITFNSSLLKEMRAIAFVTKLIEEKWLKDEYKHKLKSMLIHSIRADKMLCSMNVSTKFNVDWNFLQNLRDKGRKAAEDWLEKSYNQIGKSSTVDLRKEFLDIGGNHFG